MDELRKGRHLAARLSRLPREWSWGYPGARLEEALADAPQVEVRDSPLPKTLSAPLGMRRRSDIIMSALTGLTAAGRTRQRKTSVQEDSNSSWQ